MSFRLYWGQLLFLLSASRLYQARIFHRNLKQIFRDFEIVELKMILGIKKSSFKIQKFTKRFYE